MKKKLTDAQLHSAGATVRSKSPFDSLESYVNQTEITQKFREEWVIPFYFELNNESSEWIEKMIQFKPKITEEVILQNLGDFDWRTRSTGSYFASIKQSKHLERIIGTHLLKSEVCYTGSQYAFTIASFNTKESAKYLNQYLDYYLKRPDLYFDQGEITLALKYLDEINGTNHLAKHLKTWEECLEWRYHDSVRGLEYLKTLDPDNIEKIEKRIQELEIEELDIDTKYFHQSMDSLNQIIEG